MSDNEYIKRLEETIELMKKEMENIHAEKEAIEEKWRNYEIYDESEMWSLDLTMALFIYPRLKKLREVKHGYPSEFDSEEQWNIVFDKILQAFEYIVNNSDSYPSSTHQYQTEISEGLRLFGTYFQAMWD